MANKPTPANFSPTVPDFPSVGQFQPIYGKFDLTTYIQGASDYEIMAFLVQCYNATLKGYSDVTQLSKDTATAYNQLQTWVNTWFAELDVQQEINNKLQSMYEEGTLATAIAQSNAIPPAVAQYLNTHEGTQNLSDVTAQKIEAMAKELYQREQVFFIGRGPDAGVASEGSLKLKEISYINSFAIAAGELKHGTIALIEEDTLVIALATQDRLFEKMLSNIQEVKARGAYVIGLAKEGNREIEKQADQVLYIPDCPDEITPLLSVVPLQLLAYYIAKERGCDIDKPKNLAKSVVVE